MDIFTAIALILALYPIIAGIFFCFSIIYFGLIKKVKIQNLIILLIVLIIVGIFIGFVISRFFGFQGFPIARALQIIFVFSSDLLQKNQK